MHEYKFRDYVILIRTIPDKVQMFYPMHIHDSSEYTMQLLLSMLIDL